MTATDDDPFGHAPVLDRAHAPRKARPVAPVALQPAPAAVAAVAPRCSVSTMTLPYPPSANRYWTSRVVKNKETGQPMAITHPSSEAQAYRKQVIKAAVLNRIGQPIAGRVRIDIELYPHRPQDWAKRAYRNPITWDDDVRCIDLDNANKVLLDALKGVAIEDDKWVRELHSRRMEPDGDARVVVTITPLALPASPQASLLETA